MLSLGPELFSVLNAKQWVGSQKPVIYGVGGLSDEQISSIESELGFPLPPDFVYLFQNVIDPGGVLFPWSDFTKQKYDEMMSRILSGIEFDIEQNKLWLFRWGERPKDLTKALEIARLDFLTWPKLLPIFGHRFLAAEPFRSGNPVFSIIQTDIIYYGANLAHYLLNEFVDQDYSAHTQDKDIHRIDIWTDFVENRTSLLSEGYGLP